MDDDTSVAGVTINKELSIASGQRMRTYPAADKTISVALIIALSLLQLGCVCRYAVNFPNADDFDVYLGFLNQFFAVSTADAKLHLLFAPHSQHLQVMDRLVALTVYELLGYVNFVVIIVTGALSIPLVLWFLARQMQPHAAWLFVPVVLVLCQPNYAEATQWATTSWQFLWILVFALWAFNNAFEERLSANLTAIAVVVFATLTQGNGLLIAPVIAIEMMLQKRWVKAVTWSLIAVILFLCFHFERVTSSLPQAPSWTWVLGLLDYSLALLGSAALFTGHAGHVLLGVFVVCFLAFATVRRSYLAQPALYGFLLFSVATAMANAVARLPFGLRLAYTTDRYRLVSDMTIACIYLMLITGTQPNRRKMVGLIGGIAALCFYFAWWWRSGPEYVTRYHLLNDANLRWQLFSEGLPVPDDTVGKAIFEVSIKNGLVRLPKIDVNSYLTSATAVNGMNNTRRFEGRIEHESSSSTYLLVDGWTLYRDHTKDNGPVGLHLQSDTSGYYFPCVKRIRSDVAKHFGGSRKYQETGFLCLVRKDNLIPGRFTMAVEAGNTRRQLKGDVVVGEVGSGH